MVETKKYLLKTQDLCIGYQSKNSVDVIAENINIQFQEGELIAVIGVNGSGKSTLIKTVSNIIRPIEGEVFINNEKLLQLNEKQLSNLISLVLTKQPISRQLKVHELIALGRHPYTNWIGILTQDDKRMIQKSIQQVGISELKNKSCDELSDGQFQKVLIARALAQDTPLIILDEPTTHLDMYHKAQVLHLLKNIAASTKKCIVFASHEINLALKMCHQIVLVHGGKIIQGSPAELVQQKALHQLFPEKLIYFDETTKSFSIRV